MFNREILGERIREVRGKKSQDTFATELGISRGALSFYENAERIPDAEIIHKISESYDVSADYLLGLTDVKTTKTDLKAVCEYTRLNEDAIDALWEHTTNLYSTTSLEGKIKPLDNLDEDELVTYHFLEMQEEVLNTLLVNEEFWWIVYNYVAMQIDAEPALDEVIDIISEEPFDLFCSGEKKHVLQRFDRTTIYRYDITRSIEKISDIFDTKINRKESEGDG